MNGYSYAVITLHLKYKQTSARGASAIKEMLSKKQNSDLKKETVCG